MPTESVVTFEEIVTGGLSVVIFKYLVIWGLAGRMVEKTTKRKMNKTYLFKIPPAALENAACVEI